MNLSSRLTGDWRTRYGEARAGLAPQCLGQGADVCAYALPLQSPGCLRRVSEARLSETRFTSGGRPPYVSMSASYQIAVVERDIHFKIYCDFLVPSMPRASAHAPPGARRHLPRTRARSGRGDVEQADPGDRARFGEDHRAIASAGSIAARLRWYRPDR